MTGDLTFNYEDLRYIELREAGSKFPARKWGGYSQDFETADHVYTAEDIRLHPAEAWGVVGIEDPDHASTSLLIFDLDVHKAPDDFDPDRVSRFEPRLGLDDVPVWVGELDGRWGEYDNGTVRLNWRLILAPVRIQDYVIAHELAHSVHDTHSDPFWNTVGALIPDYEERREWLRVNGNTLTV